MHFLVTFPFEALSMNYEPSGRMDATLDHVYSRYVEQRYGGGYCMQTNLLYREMLSLLGYRILGVLGRVYSPVSDDWTGFTHTSTLVYLDSHVQGEEGKKVYYVSDVGYGSSPHRPLLLRDGWEEFGRGSEKYRLIKTEFQPRSTLEEAEDGRESEIDEEVRAVARKQRVWLLQSRKKDKDWENCYTFSPFECFYTDYQVSPSLRLAFPVQPTVQSFTLCIDDFSRLRLARLRCLLAIVSSTHAFRRRMQQLRRQARFHLEL